MGFSSLEFITNEGFYLGQSAVFGREAAKPRDRQKWKGCVYNIYIYLKKKEKERARASTHDDFPAARFGRTDDYRVYRKLKGCLRRCLAARALLSAGVVFSTGWRGLELMEVLRASSDTHTERWCPPIAVAHHG